jgi:hypothetical protein
MIKQLHKRPIGRDIMRSAWGDIKQSAAEITPSASAAPDFGVAVGAEPSHP